MSSTYPSSLPQCEGTRREEITNRVIDRAESGVIKARVFYQQPAYELTLVHTSISRDQYNEFEQWYDDNFMKPVTVNFVPDGQFYYGVISTSPTVAYESYERFTITIGISGRKVP